jgi:8-oxo-dGTP pyrophosphatase MutT (NUDIX family)
MPAVLKVLIYGTWQGRVLVFDEPDFPDLALQVPGGTVEAGEDVVTAAAREFFEETGIAAPVQPRLLMQADYRFERDGQSILHHRHFFHLPLEGAFPESWIHWEKTPFDGGPPIRFRLFWLGFEEAVRRLGMGMECGLVTLNQGAPFPTD